MAVQACVNNCDFFENGFEEDISDMKCPSGKVCQTINISIFFSILKYPLIFIIIRIRT